MWGSVPWVLSGMMCLGVWFLDFPILATSLNNFWTFVLLLIHSPTQSRTNRHLQVCIKRNSFAKPNSGCHRLWAQSFFLFSKLGWANGRRGPTWRTVWWKAPLARTVIAGKRLGGENGSLLLKSSKAITKVPVVSGSQKLLGMRETS